MSCFGQVAINTICRIKITLSWDGSKPGQSHDRCGDVKSSNLDNPLQRVNESFLNLDIIDFQQIGRIQCWVIASIQQSTNLFWYLTKDTFVSFQHTNDVLLGCVAYYCVVIRSCIRGTAISVIRGKSVTDNHAFTIDFAI
jgi:hypothetical protein